MENKAGQVFDKTPRETLNPYIHAAALVVRRLMWDCNLLSWKSRKKLKCWRNKFPGKKAVILCNGPSLNSVDFDLLIDRSIFTFGLNKINLLFDKSNFRPSCVVSVNPFVLEQNRDFFNSTDIPLFLDSKGRKWIDFRSNVSFLHSASLAGAFARDCSVSISQGSTVTYVAMQLAFHMGFSMVGLVGCDHNFVTTGPANKKVSSGKSDPNHFDSRYFANGDIWQLPDLKSSELHYEKARNTFNHFGKKLVNCTVAGKLELLERIDLEEFLKE